MAVVAAFALVLAACGGGNDKGGGGGGGGGPVKLAFFGALTGDNAQLGINIRDGAKLAIDEHNAKGGTKIELVEYDSQGDPAQAPQLAQRAVTDKVAGIIGPAFSGESKVANPIFEEAKIPNVSSSATNPKLAQNGWKFYHRVVADDDAQAPAVATYMIKKLAAKKTAVIDDNSEYGKGIADGVRKGLSSGGAAASVNESIDPKATDYSSVVTKVKAASPDAIFYGGYYAEAGKLVKQLRDGGVKGTFLSGDGSLDNKFIEGGGPASEGAILTCPCVLAGSSDKPAAQKFTTDYKAKVNADPGTYSAEGYDTATVFIKAIEAGKTTAEDINSWIATASFDGITKPIKFEANGNVVGGDIFAYEVKGGKITLQGPVSEVAK